MKLVITGSKGLIGSFTAEYAAAQQGVDVFGVDNVGIGSWRDHYLRADVSDYGQTVAALAGADAVIHLAAIKDHGLLPPAQTFAINVNSTYNVLQAATQLGIKRVVLASTIQVARTVTMQHDTRYRYLPIDEDHEIDPQTDYALSKQVGEVIGAMYARHYGISVVSLRYTGIMHPDAIASSLPRPALPPHYALYSYCDVRDAARCTFLAAVAQLPPGKHEVAYVTAQDSSVAMLSAEVAARFFAEAENRGLNGHASFVSGQRARELFGFVAEYSCRR